MEHNPLHIELIADISLLLMPLEIINLEVPNP